MFEPVPQMCRPAILTAMLAVAAVGCDSFYVVQGRVSSCVDKRPIAGAMVHLSDGQRASFTKTAADGSFTAALNEPDGDNPSKATVAIVGYRTEEHAVLNPHVLQSICLRPAGP